MEESTSNEESDEVTPSFTTEFPNAGIAVELTVQCKDCFRKTGTVVEMEPKEVADRIDNGVVYECPDCGKKAELGKYNHGGINMIDWGENKQNTDTDMIL